MRDLKVTINVMEPESRQDRQRNVVQQNDSWRCRIDDGIISGSNTSEHAISTHICRVHHEPGSMNPHVKHASWLLQRLTPKQLGAYTRVTETNDTKPLARLPSKVGDLHIVAMSLAVKHHGPKMRRDGGSRAERHERDGSFSRRFHSLPLQSCGLSRREHTIVIKKLESLVDMQSRACTCIARLPTKLCLTLSTGTLVVADLGS